MNNVIFTFEQISWLGKYAKSITMSDTYFYEVRGVDGTVLGEGSTSLSVAVDNAMEEYDTSLMDMCDEVSGELYFELREALDKFSGRELTHKECLNRLNEWTPSNE